MFLSAAGFSIFGMMRGRCSWGDMGRYGGDMGEIWDDEGALLLWHPLCVHDVDQLLGRYGEIWGDMMTIGSWSARDSPEIRPRFARD